MLFQAGHTLNKGKKLSEEHKRKIGETNQKKLREFYDSPEGKERATVHSKTLKGRTLTEEHKQKIKESSPKGEQHCGWKGNEVGYRALHMWVSKELGAPTKCENCGRDGLTGRKIQWANKSGKYLRNKSDWIRLCAKCHVLRDGTINNLKYREVVD